MQKFTIYFSSVWDSVSFLCRFTEKLHFLRHHELVGLFLFSPADQIDLIHLGRQVDAIKHN